MLKVLTLIFILSLKAAIFQFTEAVSSSGGRRERHRVRL